MLRLSAKLTRKYKKNIIPNQTTEAIDAKALFEMTCATHLSFNRQTQERKLPAAFNPAAPFYVFYSLDKYKFFFHKGNQRKYGRASTAWHILMMVISST